MIPASEWYRIVADSHDPAEIGQYAAAQPEAVEFMLDPALPVGDDGRSEWLWVRLADGTLIFGCFPTGDGGYIATEGWHS